MNSAEKEERGRMSVLSQEIKKRQRQIEKCKAELLKDKTGEAVDGRLRISKYGNYVRFYQIIEKGDTTGRYIPANKMDLAETLAQKEYSHKVLRMLEKEEKMLGRLNTFYEEESAKAGGKTFFEGPEELTVWQYGEERRKLIMPVAFDDEAYKKEWLNVAYERKGFAEDAPEYYTAEGIRVRSKTEWIIAEMLTKNNIPFCYEKPLILSDGTKIHPDFTLLRIQDRKTLYWEHLGMMDDPGYCERALERIDKCILSGIVPGQNLIITHETAAHPVRPRVLETIISRYFLGI